MFADRCCFAAASIRASSLHTGASLRPNDRSAHCSRFAFLFNVRLLVFERLFSLLVNLRLQLRSEALRCVFEDFHPLHVLLDRRLIAPFDVVFTTLFALNAFLLAFLYERRMGMHRGWKADPYRC